MEPRRADRGPERWPLTAVWRHRGQKAPDIRRPGLRLSSEREMKNRQAHRLHGVGILAVQKIQIEGRRSDQNYRHDAEHPLMIELVSPDMTSARASELLIPLIAMR